MVKQIIILRKDLNMRKGKMVAQGCHASLKVITDLLQENVSVRSYSFTPSLEIREWMEGNFKKVCVSADSEEELVSLYDKAVQANLPCSLIIDNGLTEFSGIPTKTAVAIGPGKDEEIDKITKHLKLL